MDGGPLARTVVVVVALDSAAGPAVARRLAGDGATVVLVGADAGAGGRLAGELERAGSGRPAVFVTDGADAGLDALAQFVAELFPRA